jgi:hypothetical protein
MLILYSKPYERFLKSFIIILFIITASNLFSQKEANNWYFGYRAGITFNTPDGKPVADTSSNIWSWAGSSCISDADGNLLFYTDGINIYNKIHRSMLHGGLKGQFYASQIALIMPYPPSKKSNTIKYWLFTMDDIVLTKILKYGLKTTVVDLSLDSGRGDCTKRNRDVNPDLLDKLAGINHRNKRDAWIVSYNCYDNSFYSYCVTDTGLSIPIISSSGMQVSVFDSGFVKISPLGNKLVFPGPKLTLFDFDDSTGVVSNPFLIGINAYGTEFSPDGTKLYVTDFHEYEVSKNKIFQYNLLKDTPEEIKKSIVTLAAGTDKYNGLQLGPDKKIYISKLGSQSLDVINYPDLAGLKCKYGSTEVDLQGRACRYGLPNFNQSFFSIFYGCDNGAFDYPEFKNIDKLNLVGNAIQKDREIGLSSLSEFTKGAMWYNIPLSVKNGFSTQFSFSLSNGTDNKFHDGSLPGADGFAFVIQNASPKAIGDAGHGMGYSNIPNSLAIEFDTFRNAVIPPAEVNDPNGNHIAVQSNGKVGNSSNHNTPATLGIADNIMELKQDGTVYFVKIDYNIIPNTLRIFLDTVPEFAQPSLIVPSLDLSKLLDLLDGNNAFLGFTAATGTGWENHNILTWRFCPKPPPQTTDVEMNQLITKNKSIKCYPNPFDNLTTLEFMNQSYCNISLTIYNIYGDEVQSLMSGNLEAEVHKYSWNSVDLPTGVYIARLKMGNEVQTVQLVKMN